MKKLLFLAAMAPLFSFAQPLNTMNNPNLPGYEIPSQQRMQVQMQTQQVQQKGMLNQQLQTQNRVQQQHLDTQINNDTRRVLQSQPGGAGLNGQQVLPNTSGGMLSQSANGQEHMLQPKTNGSMLKP